MYAIGPLLIHASLPVGLILLIGLFLLAVNSRTQVMSVELIGTPSPSPSIGLLMSLLTRLRVRSISHLIVVVPADSLRRSPIVFVLSGV